MVEHGQLRVLCPETDGRTIEEFWHKYVTLLETRYLKDTQNVPLPL